MLLWAGRGIRIFRVDNPHTKPIEFWSWLIGAYAEATPYVLAYVELAEGPRVMTNIVDCDPDSVRIVNNLTAVKQGRTRGTPSDFGSPHDRDPLDERGYSDHFPVTVKLKVAGAK